MGERYESPTLRVVEFRVENGCRSSVMSQNEAFADELLGNELFWDKQLQGNESFLGEAAGNEDFIE